MSTVPLWQIVLWVVIAGALVVLAHYMFGRSNDSPPPDGD